MILTRIKGSHFSFFWTSSDCVLCEPVDGAVFHRSPTHPSIISLQWVHCFHILSYLLYPRTPTVHFCDSSLSPFLSLSLFDLIRPSLRPPYISHSLSRIHPAVRAVPDYAIRMQSRALEKVEDGVKLKCRGGGRGGGTYTQTHNSQSTLGDWRGPRNLSSLEHLILGSGPRTTISVHNWHRPPETL